MKRFLTMAVFAALLSTNAFAFGNTSNSNNNNDNVNNSSAGGYASQGQQQGQFGINKSKNDNTNKVTDSGNSKSTSANALVVGGDSFVEAENMVNTAYAPVVIATSDCLGSLSAGGQGSGIGLSFGGTTQSKPCNVREFAKMNIGNISLFYAIQCQDPIVKEAFKVTGDYQKYCVGAKAKGKTKKWFGLASKKAYEDVCAYPTAECKRFKRMQ